MDSVNKESMDHYYNLLEKVLSEHNLHESPGQIYNMDETGIPRPPKVLTKYGEKKVRYRQLGNKEQISVIGCRNTAGQATPPMVIFEGKYLNYLWTVGEVPGAIYGMTGKGWTNQQIFFHWLTHFLKYANPGRPLLLLLDGHSSHFELSSIELAREKKVEILCLPPHTTHESQSLDSAVFGPLKKVLLDRGMSLFPAKKNQGVLITKYNFSKIFSSAWLKSLFPQNLIAGFRKCSVLPLNCNAIKVIEEDPQCSTSTGKETTHSNSTNAIPA